MNATMLRLAIAEQIDLAIEAGKNEELARAIGLRVQENVGSESFGQFVARIADDGALTSVLAEVMKC